MMYLAIDAQNVTIEGRARIFDFRLDNDFAVRNIRSELLYQPCLRGGLPLL